MTSSTLLQTQLVASKDESQTQAVNTIQIGTLEAFLGVAAVLIGIGIAWGTLRTLVKGIKQSLDEIRPELKDLRERFIVVEERVGTTRDRVTEVEGRVNTMRDRFTLVEGRVDTIWKDRVAPATSPRQLNEQGREILEKSGIKEIIDGKKDKLLALVREKKITNPYDAEEAILAVVMDLPKHCPEIVDGLKNGAFRVGANIDLVLFVGGMYLRNQIFGELGFTLEELDKEKE